MQNEYRKLKKEVTIEKNSYNSQTNTRSSNNSTQNI